MQLTQELDRRRRIAKTLQLGIAATASSCPQSPMEWDTWLGQNEERWAAMSRAVRAGARRQINKRLTPDVAAPAGDQVKSVRLQPRDANVDIPWSSLVTNGWLAILAREMADLTSPHRALLW